MALVEWGDLAAPALGESALEVTLGVPDPVGAAGAPSRHDGRGAGAGRTGRTRWRPALEPAARAGGTVSAVRGGRTVPGGGHRDGDRDGRRRRADAGGRAGRVRADRTPPPRRDADARPRAPAGPGGPGAGGPRRRGGRHRSGALHRPAGRGRRRPRRWPSRSASGSSAATSLDILTAGAAGAGHRGLGAGLRRRPPGARCSPPCASSTPTGPSWRSPSRPACSRRPTWWPRWSELGGAPVLAVGDGALRYRRRPRGAAGGRARGRRPCRSRRRRRCSTWPWRASRRENRQSSRVASFPSTCVRRTQRATSPGRSGPERVPP